MTFTIQCDNCGNKRTIEEMYQSTKGSQISFSFEEASESYQMIECNCGNRAEMDED